jgi:hypothetical protein
MDIVYPLINYNAWTGALCGIVLVRGQLRGGERVAVLLDGITTTKVCLIVKQMNIR